MHMKLAVIDKCLTRMQIASKLRNLGVWIISTLKVSRTRNAPPPPLPDGRGQWNNEKPGGDISSRHAAVSQEDNQVSVIERISICFDEIRSEGAADFWRTDRRLVVAKRMLHDVFGPGFSDTSPESRRRSDSLRDRLWPHLLYNGLGGRTCNECNNIRQSHSTTPHRLRRNSAARPLPI